jgi:eukaryotic-like serine/threonine-protein kinase
MSFDPRPPSRFDVKKSVSPSGEMAPRPSLAAVFTTVPSCLGSDQGSSTLLRTDEYMSIPARPVRLEWKKISSPSAVIDGSESVLQHRRHPRRRVPLVRYFIAFLHGDVEDMKRKAALARERPSSEDMMSHVEALALARSGRLQKAARTSTVAVDIARRSGRRERAALFDAATAVWEAFYGNAAAAGQKATTALDLARGRDVDYAAAFALILSGDVARSRALFDDLAKNLPEDTSVQYLYLPTLRALYSLTAHDPTAAIHALQAASRYDLALGGIGFTGRFGGLYPIYVRGLAYLAVPSTRRSRWRVPADSRSSKHRPRRSDGRHGGPATGESARALGDTVKAKSAYSDLLTLWENADPKIPMVEVARAESARLP